MVQYFAPEIIEAQLVDRLRLGIELDRNQIKGKGCKSEGFLVDVKAGQLIV